MKFKRKQKEQKEYPQLPPTELNDNQVMQTLKQLPDEVLEAELLTATNTEGWFRSTAASFEENGPADLSAIHMRAASYARLTREVMATILVTRREGNDGGSKPEGYL